MQNADQVAAAEFTVVANDAALGPTLQAARRERRLSQLELSLRLQVSQRHVSFVESGRARPSRPLLLAWLQALELPLVQRNRALLLAGHAPAYAQSALDDPQLAQVRLALDQMLQAQDRVPALVLDADWNLLRLNRGALWLAERLMPGAAALLQAGPPNLLDLLVHPQGWASHICNLDEVGPQLLDLLRHDASLQPSLRPRLQAYEAFLRQRLGAGWRPAAAAPSRAPVLVTRFALPEGELAFFSLFTTFGTPQDITLASLRIEHMFPADEATRQALLSALG